MDKGKEALIIIDMQNDFVLPGAPACVAGARATVPCIRRLLEVFRAGTRPVFHVTVPGTPGCEIVAELAPRAGEYRVIKQRFSGFMQTELDFMLRRLGVTRLVVCGTQYPNCVRATIFDALCLGYPVTNVIDATSAQTQEIADANIRDLRNVGVDCITLDDYLERQSARA